MAIFICAFKRGGTPIMPKELKGLEKLLSRDPRVRFRYDERLGVVLYLRGNLESVGKDGSKGLRRAASRFLSVHRDLFGNVRLARTSILEETVDPRGGRSLTLQQYHGSFRVYGGSIRFHVSNEGILDTVNNRLFPDLADVPRRARVTEGRAIKVARAGTHCGSPPERKPELLVYRHEGEPHLVWEIRLNDTKAGERGVPARWIAYVDAVRGRLLLYYDNVQTAGPVVGSGTGYYSGAGAVNAWFNDTTYQLRDTTRSATAGPGITTDDADGASPSEDPNNNWNDVATSPRDQNQGAEVDAHRYAAAVADYFRTVHGRNSFDGAGGAFISLVHYGTDYSNGFWDGTKVNLGDGSGVAPGDDYECSDDWLAHEFTHGYTQYTAALQYLNESGALNEAISDIFAAFITGDWLVFEDTWLKATAPAWRNMMDPTNGGQWDNSSEASAEASVLAGHQPSHYSVRYTGTWDNGGVHVNSGIINNLFYLLTVGGTHTVSGITVTGIGQSPAEQLLFRCLTVNLAGNPTATFLDFREAMLDACLDLFPTDLVKLSQVKNAFNAVGIGPDLYVRDNLADTGLEPYPGAYLWASPDIINRTSQSLNPAMDFADLTDDMLWQNVEAGQSNYIYVRVQNRGAANGDATIGVYFSAATTFGTPASWILIGTLTETAIPPGGVRVAGPLIFPAGMIPSPGHYCMIAVASDGLDPAPDHTLIASVSDYLEFVRNTNNIAYRNMDVVDLVPGAPGTVGVVVRSLPRARERYNLRIDVGRFALGAKIRIRGPALSLDGAIARGMKLAAREKGENVYEMVIGLRRVEDQPFARFGMFADFALGFDNVLVEKDFRLAVEYVFPEDDARGKTVRSAPREGYALVVRQLWQGQLVGAYGIRLRSPARPPRLGRRSPRVARARRRQ